MGEEKLMRPVGDDDPPKPPPPGPHGKVNAKAQKAYELELRLYNVEQAVKAILY